MDEFMKELWEQVDEMGANADNPQELRARADFLAQEGRGQLAEELVVLAYVLERVAIAKGKRGNMAAS